MTSQEEKSFNYNLFNHKFVNITEGNVKNDLLIYHLLRRRQV